MLPALEKLNGYISVFMLAKPAQASAPLGKVYASPSPITELPKASENSATAVDPASESPPVSLPESPPVSPPVSLPESPPVSLPVSPSVSPPVSPPTGAAAAEQYSDSEVTGVPSAIAILSNSKCHQRSPPAKIFIEIKQLEAVAIL